MLSYKVKLLVILCTILAFVGQKLPLTKAQPCPPIGPCVVNPTALIGLTIDNVSRFGTGSRVQLIFSLSNNTGRTLSGVVEGSGWSQHETVGNGGVVQETIITPAPSIGANVAIRIDFYRDGDPIIGETFHSASLAMDVAYIDLFVGPTLPSGDIAEVFSRVRKNDNDYLGTGGSSLLDNLEPLNSFVTVTATIVTDDTGATWHVNYPQSAGRSYSDFMCNNSVGDERGDGDINFSFQLDASILDPRSDFWVNGWRPGLGGRTRDAASRYLYLFGGEFHGEIIMYGGSASCNDIGRSGMGGLLPGWAQQDQSSVFMNSQPMNGQLTVPFHIGDHVRITGVLVLDCGHAEIGNSRPCHEGGDSTNHLEIHPVYSVDVIPVIPGTQQLCLAEADQLARLQASLVNALREARGLPLTTPGRPRRPADESDPPPFLDRDPDVVVADVAAAHEYYDSRIADALAAQQACLAAHPRMAQ